MKLLRISFFMLMIICYLAIAAINKTLAMTHWGFQDGFVTLFEGNAPRPFIYRLLIIKTVSAIEWLTPNDLKETLMQFSLLEPTPCSPITNTLTWLGFGKVLLKEYPIELNARRCIAFKQ